MQTRIATGPDPAQLQFAPSPSDRFAFHNRFVPLVLRDRSGNPVASIVADTLRRMSAEAPVARPNADLKVGPGKKGRHTAILVGSTTDDGGGGPGDDRPGDDIEGAALAAEFGVILLERTRVRPAGFVLGEHLLSLSLAPGEEVTIEQKTFSERSVTFEEINDREEEVTTEVGSTLTTELSEALTRVMSDTKSRAFNVGGSLGFSYFVSLSLSAGYTDSVTNALTSTRGETVRNVMTKTEKLTARRRAQHKTTMKISETSRFESGSKRVLRNPNQYTPIDLVYFKVLQKLKLSHERIGVRLCWAPFIPDPGVVLDQAEAAERLRVEAANPLHLPDAPVHPTAPGAPSPVVVNSGTQELDKWGQPWGDMRADYWFNVAAPRTGFIWDGDKSSIVPSVSTTGFGMRGAPSVFVVRAEAGPTTDTGVKTVNVLIHAGADWGGAGAHIYTDFNVRFIADMTSSDANYQAALATYQTAMAVYQQDCARLRAEHDSLVQTSLATWRMTYLKTFDPVSAAFQLLIAMLFEPNQRDEGYEIELWNKVFDFESTAFQYYPSWWSNRARRNPEKAADAFENASWMRVFLPIRPQFEEQALNLLLERRVHTGSKIPHKREAIDKVLEELNDARTTYFGGTDEIQLTAGTPCPTATRPYVCLADWDDVLPTDGTHLEVVQAKTTAMDDTSEQSLLDAHALLGARVTARTAEGALTQVVGDKVADTATTSEVDIHVGIGTRADESR